MIFPGRGMASGTVGSLSLVTSPAPHRLACAGRGGPRDRVAHLGGAVAVLEVRAVGADAAAGRDRVQEVMELVDEGVLPPDHVPRGPPVRHEGLVGVRD